MYISEQIENILDNHNLNNDRVINAMFAKDLSSYENYNGEELVQAVIDNYYIELADIISRKPIVKFTAGPTLIGVLMPSSTMYRSYKTMSQSLLNKLDDYCINSRVCTEMQLENLSMDAKQTVNLLDSAQVYDYENQ